MTKATAKTTAATKLTAKATVKATAEARAKAAAKAKAKARVKVKSKAKAKAEAGLEEAMQDETETDLLGDLPDLEWRGFIEEASKSAAGVTSERSDLTDERVRHDEVMDVEIHSGFGSLENADSQIQRTLEANPDLHVAVRPEYRE